jgi:Cys-tRNA(Pro)/Cys-tRNA(Cys) deacylase
MVTNNITRFLEAHKVPYEAFELPEEKLGALETARRLGVAPETVFKSIVVLREKPSAKPVLCIIPGPNEVDLKAVASLLNEKKVHVPTQAEAERLTGMQAGGISPLALINRGFQMLIDEAALEHEKIHVSGGQRGLNIRLPVKALMELTRARAAKISL